MKPTLNKDELVSQILKVFRSAQFENESALKEKISSTLNGFLDSGTSTQAREITVLLADIRGFTALSERYQAEQIVSMLNNFFTKMNDVVFQYDGIIDKYMGDAMMVLFGVQDDHPDDVKKAVACAVEMQLAMDSVNQANKAQGLPDLFMGIGINTGTVSAGHVGSDLHNEYTVIGDGVNLASRIESHSLRGQILISQSSYERVKDEVEIGNLNSVRVKGKSEPVGLYEIKAINWKEKLEVPQREIRTSVRVDVDTNFAFQVIKGKEILNQVHTGQLKDISYNGLFAIIQDELEPYTDIKISMALSLLGGETRDIYAKIMNVRKMTEGYGCGIEFTSIDEESQQSVKEFIDRIIEGY